MEPIAYLLRERRRGMSDKILCGKMFMNAEPAAEAAARMTNHWRTVTVVPVMEVAGDRQNGHEMSNSA